MENIENWVQAFNGLVKEGKRLRAMQIFYSTEFRMNENMEETGNGKDICLAREIENMKMVTQFECQLINQAIDCLQNIVFSEWIIVYTDNDGEQIRLTEVSVQNWKNGQIIREKFYYKETPELERELIRHMLN